MIAFLDGVLEEKQPTRAVLNAGGVGYEVFIPVSSYDRLPGEGARCRLLIHEHIREDAHVLYGFATADERHLFERLIAISNIGPKTALSALSGLTPRDLKAAVAANDLARLSSIPGIGKKTAERIVVELRHKLREEELVEAAAGGAGVSESQEGKRRDAILALAALGYKAADARQAVHAVPAGELDALSVEQIIRRVLTGR